MRYPLLMRSSILTRRFIFTLESDMPHNMLAECRPSAPVRIAGPMPTWMETVGPEIWVSC